jgi:hypothetical protein
VFDRAVAIKEFLPTDAARRFGDARVGPRGSQYREDFESGLREFVEEARMLDRFEHPHVVRVRSFFRDNDTAYLVMEHVEGPTLAAWLETHQSPASADVVQILRSLADGLAYVHSQGCLHRDVKPDNIILRGGRVDAPVLIDFGSARKAIAERTRSIAALVSAGYTPLEQYSSHRAATPATDLYAFCAVAYRCIVGHDPPSATDRAIHDSIARLGESGAGRFPPELLEALDMGLALRVTERSADLELVRDVLHAHERDSAPAVQRRGAGRDRNRQTMKVAFTDVVEPKAAVATPEVAAEPSPAAHGAAVQARGHRYPKPIAVGLWALAVGGAAYLRLGSNSTYDDARVLELVVLAFPAAAFLGAWLVQRWLARVDAGTLRHVSVVVAGYVATALLADTFYVLLVQAAYIAQYRGFDGALMLYGPFGYYLFFFETARVEFLVFAAGFIGLHFLAGRLAWLDAVLPSRLDVAAVFPGALLLVLAATVAGTFAGLRETHVDQSLRTEFYRTGLLLDTSDEALAAAVSAAQSQGVADDAHHVAVYEWLREQPTRTEYSVGASGSDFTTIQSALDHVGRLNDDDKKGLVVRVAPGVYRESLSINVPVEIVGEGGPTILSPGGTPAIRFGWIYLESSAVALRGFRVRSNAVDSPLVVIPDGMAVSLEGNAFTLGTAEDIDRCIVIVGDAVEDAAVRDAVVAIRNNAFEGSCGIRLRGSAHVEITDNDLMRVTPLPFLAADSARATLENNMVFPLSTGLIANDAADITVRAGSVPRVRALGSSRVTLAGVRLVNDSTCVTSEGAAAIAIDASSIDCGGAGSIVAVENSTIAISNSTFRLDARFGPDPSWYVRDDTRQRISFTGTTAQ